MAVKRKSESVTFADLGVSPKELFRHYHDMLLIRRFEERAGQMYGMGLIGGFCHLYIGQEGVVVGMQAALKEGDTIVTSYRDHGHMLACGMDPKGVMAELTGRRTGYSHGKGGSMHMFSREKNFFGGHGIVGAQVPIGTGLAFASCGEGVITVVHEDSPDRFSVFQTVSTERGARTMALDPRTHAIYTVTARFGPPPKATQQNPHPYPHPIANTFTALAFRQ